MRDDRVDQSTTPVADQGGDRSYASAFVAQLRRMPMITANDVRFHVPEDMPYDWAETNYFSVNIPEENITISIYTVARPGVGAYLADIEVINRIGRNIIDAVYVDFAQHLPMPERLEDYSLPNGLSVKTFNEPRGYIIDYVGQQDTELDRPPLSGPR